MPARNLIRALATLGVAASLLAGTAIAADIDYDPRRSQALRRCDEPAHRGRLEQARDCYGGLLRAADPLTRAEALFALDDLRAANDAFREAVAANPQAPLPKLRWGRMFMAAGQYNDAMQLFQEVLEAFPATPLLIEIKAPLAATQVKRIIEELGATERVVVDSFKPEALKVFRDSGIATGASRNGIARILRESLGGKSAGPVDFRVLCTPLTYYGMPLPVKRFPRVGTRHDVRVHVWTVNDTGIARDLWMAGVNGIITDDPAVMLDLRSTLAVTYR